MRTTVDVGAGRLARQLLEGLAGTVPGVVGVRTSQPTLADGVGPAEGDRQ